VNAAIELQDIAVRYGEHVALDGVNLSIDQGLVTALIGMNGSGKSTLFKTIMGLVKPERGTTTLAGGDPDTARKTGRVAYVPQGEEVDWQFPVSVREVVMMGRYGHQGFTRRPSKADHDAVDHALHRVELTELAKRQIGQLSGGQRKRAFVARAIAQGADIVLLDEPFAGVDKRLEGALVSLLRELAGEGKTIVVSTHDLQSLPALADRAVLLLRRVLFHGLVKDALVPEQLTRAFGLDVGDAP